MAFAPGHILHTGPLSSLSQRLLILICGVLDGGFWETILKEIALLRLLGCVPRRCRCPDK
jgi:hypothetical protein